jgi:TetR/AcrR family transcriptional regulator, lmrAB and yxaGH operons repressor
MSKGQATRERIVASTVDLLMQYGYHATGLNQIVAHSEAPKGSLYFHFPEGKEQIVAEALIMAGDWTCEHISAILDESDTIAGAMAEVAQFFSQMLEESEFTKSCPLLAVSQEISSTDERIRQALDDAFDAWHKVFTQKFVESGFPESVANTWATFSLSAVEGAQALSRAQRSLVPLEQTSSLLSTLVGNAQQMYRLA